MSVMACCPCEVGLRTPWWGQTQTALPWPGNLGGRGLRGEKRQNEREKDRVR